ncbi:phage tail protein [Gynuella sunshinyii]|uniref:Microcystin-dependent protein n=1 Tax=Gynuella sunshinyii YC6258 TaxID=1445510 RepID=A0A0C5VIZ1_9GAMM|nr:tail fiber protein [Gynuella sunshinyii]AJQ93338.1 microcystin-dependent protein [Gynuella sunshinyii YC6258]
MAESYIGEIRIFAGTFAPRQWTFCEGQILSIADHSALYAVIGTAYGGDGRSSFGLPDCRGRLPVHTGNGNGLTPRVQGQSYGSERVTLTVDQLPAHTHLFQVSGNAPDEVDPAGMYIAKSTHYAPVSKVTATGPLASESILPVGQSGYHENMMPTMFMNFILSLLGTFPSRN